MKVHAKNTNWGGSRGGSGYPLSVPAVAHPHPPPISRCWRRVGGYIYIYDIEIYMCEYMCLCV